MNIVDIWQPKWSTRQVLIGKHKLLSDPTIIRFTKIKDGNEWAGVWSVSKKEIMSSQTVNNGKIDCWAVPLDKLTRVENI